MNGERAATRVSARTIQVGLGVLWILDGALQLQPRMFGPDFASQVIAPASAAQPALLAWPILHMAGLISVQPVAWDVLFACVQVLIGLGLLRRETVRPALALSFVWTAAVWGIGEGLGSLLTGAASPLTGAPGAVLIYGVIGGLVWPRRAADVPAPGAPAASEGVLGDRGGRAAWAVLWVGMAALWLLPASSGSDALSGMLQNAATSSPQWLAHLQESVTQAVAGHGATVAGVIAAASAAIGIGPLLVGRPTWFLVAGAALSLDFWALGQSFGGISTGLATDPNSGPLFVLLALALFPGVRTAATGPNRTEDPAQRPQALVSARAAGSAIAETSRKWRTAWR